MGRVTVDLDDKTEKMARAAARAGKVSLSWWVAERVQQWTRTEWPSFVRELAGAWEDLPSAETLRKDPHGL